MRTAETEIEDFNASGAGPAHESLRAKYDNFLRARPDLSAEECFALAWQTLSLAERNHIRAEESGEAQAREAEDARRRASAMKGTDMSKVDVGALALLALEGVAEGLRKSDPSLSKSQAVARAIERRPDIFSIERAASYEKLSASLTPQREMAQDELIAKRDNALDELRKLANDIRARAPRLTPSQAFARAYASNSTLASRERQASRELLYAV